VTAAATGTITLLPWNANAASDVFETDSGEVTVHPVSHASFIMQTPAGVIYADPVGGADAYSGLPDPDLILVTHRHGDHYDEPTLTALADGGVPIITCADVLSMMPDGLKGQPPLLLCEGGVPRRVVLTGSLVRAHSVNRMSSGHRRPCHEAVVIVHWIGGRHTELRVARVRTGRYPADRAPCPVEVMRTLGGQWPDRELAVTMNRMRCRAADGQTWTTVRVAALRERLGIAPFDPSEKRPETISVDAAAHRLGICVGSVHRLIRQGLLPARQLMPSAPWQVPVDALTTDAVAIGVRDIVARRPKNLVVLQDDRTLRLPGI
jgi:hypothetical protein